jgi:hypothetical protein
MCTPVILVFMIRVDDPRAAWMGLVCFLLNVVEEFQPLHTVSMSQVASRIGDLESGIGSGTLTTTPTCRRQY